MTGYGGGGYGAPRFGASPYAYGAGLNLGGGGGFMPGGGASSTAKRIGKWLAGNGQTVVEGAGVALGYLGDRSAQKSAERQQVVSNDQWSQENAFNARQVAVSEKELQAKLDADSAEKRRRGEAIRQILAMSRTPVKPSGTQME